VLIAGARAARKPAVAAHHQPATVRGDAAASAQLDAEIENHKLAGRIDVLGALPARGSPSSMWGSDMFVLLLALRRLRHGLRRSAGARPWPSRHHGAGAIP